MPSSQNILLQRFVQTQDPEAFSEIVHRYAGLVYGTCMRVLADADKAADVVQDTFLQLLKNADSIRGSVPTWLHRVATNKSVDVIRRDSSRRKREARYLGDQPRQVTEWSELSRYVDEGLETLDPQTRQLIVAHFLQGATTIKLADACGVSQPTISRRIDSGVAQLRGFLKKRGILVAAAALSSMLTANAVQAAPAAVLTELGKISLVGGPAAAAASTTAVESAAGGLLATAKAKVIATAAAAVIGAGTAFVIHNAATGGDADSPLSAAPSEPVVSSSAGVTTESPSSRATTSPTQLDNSPLIEQTQPDTVADNNPDAEMPAVTGTAIGAAAADNPAPAPAAMGYGGAMAMGGYSGAEVSFVSPETTISSFASMLATGDLEKIAVCFAPGAADLGDLTRILAAPEDEGDLMMKQVLESVGPPVEVTEIIEQANGLGVKWLFTVTRPFVIAEGGAGMTFEPGDKFEMDATLVQVDGQWLIAGI